MIEIRLIGSVEEIREDARRLFGCGCVTSSVTADAATPSSEGKAEAPVEAAETPSQSSEKKDEETVAEAAEAPQNAPETRETTPSATEENSSGAAEEAPAVTMIEARARMNELRQKKGAPAVRAVLDGLGYKKFTDVPESDYPKLMVCCDAMENSDV